MKLHIPISDRDRKVKIEPEFPVLFLAGPIRNAPKWQEEAIKYIIDWELIRFNVPINIFVASPTRTLSPKLMALCEKDDDNYEEFSRQRAWEQYYLNEAAERGCIVFWLPKEAEIKDDENKVYAHITMMELGEWIARKTPDTNIVIGTDGEFPEWSTIKYEIESEHDIAIPICYSLEETITKALTLIQRKNKI